MSLRDGLSLCLPACAPTVPHWSHSAEASLDTLPWQRKDEEHHPSRSCSPCWVAAWSRKDPYNFVSLSQVTMWAVVQVWKVIPEAGRPELKILLLDADIMYECLWPGTLSCFTRKWINDTLAALRKKLWTCVRIAWVEMRWSWKLQHSSKTTVILGDSGLFPRHLFVWVQFLFVSVLD